MDSEHRIRELEARLVELSAEVRELRGAAHASAPAAPNAAAPAEVTQVASSRRGVLRLAGAAAAGGAALLLSRPDSVAAVDGDPVKVSQTTASTPATTTPTVLQYTNTIAPKVTFNSADVAANIFLVRDDPTSPATFNPDGSTAFPSAVAGYAFRTVPNGVYGYTQRPGYGVVGLGAVAGATGVYAQGLRANVELKPGGTSPLARTDAHNAGELVVDSDGSLWVCVTPGTPGTWRKLAGTASAGAFHAITPSRVFDSRVAAPSPGVLAFNTPLTVSVASKRDATTGAVVTADLVPAGASAISVNLAVVDTVGAGFVTLNPGGVTTKDTASINWSASGQILNNGVIVALNATRQVTAIVGGSSTTRANITLDVTGYWL